MKQVFEESAGIIVFNQKTKKFLVLEYNASHFDFPKGHLEKNETPKKAALRELKEETGIKENQISFVKGFKEEINYSFKRKKEIVTKKVTFFLAKTSRENIKISFEHKNFFWLPYQKAYKKLTYSNVKELLKKASKVLTQKTVSPYKPLQPSFS